MTVLAPYADPAVRRSGIGGSDIAKLLGISRFGGPMDLWLEKTGQSAPLVETPVMRWGKLLEDPIAREYAHQTGRKVRRVNSTLRHPQHEELFCHLDRTAHKKGEAQRVLEAKTAGPFQAADFGEPGTDQVPDDYLIQVQHYLGITGFEQADLAVLIGGQKFAIYEIPRDDTLIGEMYDEALRFWTDNVVARVPPPLDGSEASSRYLAARFKDTGTAIPMTEDIKTLAFAYKGLVAGIASAEEQKKIIGNHLREELGDAAKAEGDGVKVAWADVKGHEVAAHFVTGFRRLTVTIKDQP